MKRPTNFRDLERTRALFVRSAGSSGKYRCDCCGRWTKNVEMHEIFPRRITQGNEEARQASFQVELVAILCPACHTHCAETRGMAEYYLKENIRRWKLANVRRAYDELNSLMVLDLGVDIDRINRTFYPNPCKCADR